MICALKENGEQFQNWDREIQRAENWAKEAQMEDILVDQEQRIVVDLSTKPTAMSQDDWDKL